jgi:hypothetical protein
VKATATVELLIPEDAGARTPPRNLEITAWRRMKHMKGSPNFYNFLA